MNIWSKLKPGSIWYPVHKTACIYCNGYTALWNKQIHPHSSKYINTQPKYTNKYERFNYYVLARPDFGKKLFSHVLKFIKDWYHFGIRWISTKFIIVKSLNKGQHGDQIKL